MSSNDNRHIPKFNEWMNEWMNEWWWMDGWMTEQMNKVEGKNERRTNESWMSKQAKGMNHDEQTRSEGARKWMYELMKKTNRERWESIHLRLTKKNQKQTTICRFSVKYIAPCMRLSFEI